MKQLNFPAEVLNTGRKYDLVGIKRVVYNFLVETDPPIRQSDDGFLVYGLE